MEIQIATTKDQSARLLSCGVSADTADMCYQFCEEFLFIFAMAALGTLVAILLAIAGRWIGIGDGIFRYLAMFCIFWKAWDVLAWVVDKISDRVERTERLNMGE